MKKIMIAWVEYQRRADCMKEHWGYSLHHIHTAYGKSTITKPLDYLVKILKTIRIFITERPDQLWIQLPPSLLLHLAFLYKNFANKQCTLVADLHNSMLRNKWMKFPFFFFLLNKMDVVLAHNEAVKDELIALGVQECRVHVLEDFPFKYDISPTYQDHNPAEKYLIFPCSFDIDEPIWSVLAAAKLTPIKFYITGNSKKFSNKENTPIPSNVIFTGYLKKEEYEELLLKSSIVLGLTTRQNVQLRVANEGLSASKPLILSNTTTLRKLYSGAALFVENEDPSSLADSINHALSNLDALSESTENLMLRRIERWKTQAAQTMIN